MRVVFAFAFVLGLLSSANAQSLSPMRGEIRSFSDRFAVRLYVGNPYDRRMQFNIGVYDRKFHPVIASVNPARVTVAGGQTSPVLVVVPFEGESERRIRICVEGVAYRGNSTRVRTQVCGKFLARSYLQ
jgi:hypothetical protein